MKNCPVCGNPIDDNQGICSNCGSVITDDMGSVDSILSGLDDDFNLDAYKDYLSDTAESSPAAETKAEEKADEPEVIPEPEVITEPEPIVEEIEEEIEETVEQTVEETVPEAEEIVEETAEEAEETVEQAVEEVKQEEPVFEIFPEKLNDEDDEDEEEEEDEDEPVIQEQSPAEEPVPEEVEEVEEEAPSFRIITDKPDAKPVVSVFETEVISEPEPMPEAEEIKEEAEEEIQDVKEEVEQIIPEPVAEEESFVVVTDEKEQPADKEEVAEEVEEDVEEKPVEEEPVEKAEIPVEDAPAAEPSFVIDNSFSFESAGEEDTEDEGEDTFVPEPKEEPAPEKPQTEYTSSDYLSMTERIRKYQIIPDSLPVEPGEEDIQPIQPKPAAANQPAITMQKITVEKKRPKWLGKAIAAFVVIAVIAVGAIVVLTNDSLKEKVSSIFSKEPVEQSEVVGNVSFKWVKGKKYSSDFDVLKIDKEALKSMIEKSLKDNCTSEYDTLSEHYFGAINGSDNYIGYIDNVGVGIIFELTETDNLIKSIYVIADTSSDVNKGETLISEYTVCILNALGEIKDLSYKNIGMYASSIKLNNFKSVATYTRYNNFVLKKYMQENYSALIINHGDNSSIKKFSQSEVLELVNCADEKYLTEAATEPTTEKKEEVEVTEYEESVVYEIKTAGDPLRIRKEPNTDSEVLGTFDNGTQVEVFGITGDWAKIKYNNEDAWLAVKFIEKVEEE